MQLISDFYKYKFQGQELQDELGLGWYSYKWRNYDPAIARFMSIDPLTEEYEDYTPYQFSSNQPVHAKELEGLESSNDLNKNKPEKTDWQKSYNPKTGNTDIGKFVVIKVVGFFDSINTYKKDNDTKTSDKDLGTTVTSKKGGNENPKTTGAAGESIEVDALLSGAPGAAAKGNNFKTAKDAVKAIKDLNSGFKKGQKSVENVVDQSRVTDVEEPDSITTHYYDQKTFEYSHSDKRLNENKTKKD